MLPRCTVPPSYSYLHDRGWLAEFLKIRSVYGIDVTYATSFRHAYMVTARQACLLVLAVKTKPIETINLKAKKSRL